MHCLPAPGRGHARCLTSPTSSSTSRPRVPEYPDEGELDDDAESIITNERYVYIAEVIKACYKKKNAGALTSSDKIDKIVTNRWLGLPIFAVVMFLVYWIAMVAVGAPATDWANDGLFGDGWHLFGIGSAAYNKVAEQYGDASAIVDGYDAYVEENGAAPEGEFTYEVEDEETLEITEETATLKDYEKALATLDEIGDEPDPADYGVWVPGIPVLIGNALEAAGAAEWLSGLILDGIVAGVGAGYSACAADARPLPAPRVRSLRLHGPYRVRSRPCVPQVRPFR